MTILREEYTTPPQEKIAGDFKILKLIIRRTGNRKEKKKVWERDVNAGLSL